MAENAQHEPQDCGSSGASPLPYGPVQGVKQQLAGVLMRLECFKTLQSLPDW